jgi:isocitrate lyase
MYGVWNAMEELVRKEAEAQWHLERVKVGHPTESHHVMARVEHFKELEKKYIPGTADRYRKSDGFGEERSRH